MENLEISGNLTAVREMSGILLINQGNVKEKVLSGKSGWGDKLQRAQNNLARVVCQSQGRTDTRPLLHSLHWLPLRQRVINWLY